MSDPSRPEPQPEPALDIAAPPEPPPAAPAASSILANLPSLGAAQRAIESIVIAVVTSSGLYLIGTVYLEAFYGRMSIDAAALDFNPPFVALQAMHVLPALLEYPISLLFLFFLYRMITSRAPRLRAWYQSLGQRFGRLFLVLINLLTVSPLLVAAVQAGTDLALIDASSVLSEVAELMMTIGSLLFFYILWLSFGPRLTVLSQIREHRLLPLTLIFLLYLLDALVASAHGAALDAELLMTGSSASSVTIEFTLADDVQTTLPDTELLLVTTRLGNFYVVERQPMPPSTRPVAYVIPSGSVDSARLQRVTDSNLELWEFVFDEMFGTPIPVA